MRAPLPDGCGHGITVARRDPAALPEEDAHVPQHQVTPRAGRPALVVLATLGAFGLGAATADAKPAAPAAVTGTAAVALDVRAAPGAGRVVGRLAKGQQVRIQCQANGPRSRGPYGASRIYDRVGRGDARGFVPDNAVFTGSDGTVAGICGVRQTSGATKPGRIATQALNLKVRRGPTTAAREVASLARGTAVRISCQTSGPAVAGTYGTSTIWNRITSPVAGFVPDAYTYTGSDGRVAPDCRRSPDPGGDQPPPGDDGPKPGQREEGRCTSDVPFPLEGDPGGTAAFVQRYGGAASGSDRRTGVPGSVTLGQGILESGSGASTAGANNYFGIKAASRGGGRYRWGDEAVGCVIRRTAEQDADGAVYYVNAAFRLYRTPADSFTDHGEFLAESSRYRSAFRVKNRSNAFLRRVWRAGYATDTQYADKVIGLMRQYDLYRFDVR